MSGTSPRRTAPELVKWTDPNGREHDVTNAPPETSEHSQRAILSFNFFEELFKKLATDYKHVLNDDEKLENNNKMQVEKIEDSNVS